MAALANLSAWSLVASGVFPRRWKNEYPELGTVIKVMSIRGGYPTNQNYPPLQVNRPTFSTTSSHFQERESYTCPNSHPSE